VLDETKSALETQLEEARHRLPFRVLRIVPPSVSVPEDLSGNLFVNQNSISLPAPNATPIASTDRIIADLWVRWLSGPRFHTPHGSSPPEQVARLDLYLEQELEGGATDVWLQAAQQFNTDNFPRFEVAVWALQRGKVVCLTGNEGATAVR